ncbi:MAG: universal stress protein [Hyphomicrobiaceae bacterium]|nr:universal stress protein [Hyphomicrobiaceae bacterium]
MFKKIVVPVDPVETSFASPALTTAAGLAKDSGGQVHIIAVMQPMNGYVAEFLPADFEAKTESTIKETIVELAASVGLTAENSTVSLKFGGVYHEVIDEASNWGADLIVVSSHRPTMSTYLLGSNAAKIVRHAPCSVMVLRT